MTGISQCGKTELGKTISYHFVLKGFDYQIYNEIDTDTNVAPELKEKLEPYFLKVFETKRRGMLCPLPRCG